MKELLLDLIAMLTLSATVLTLIS